jgi:hypothetical protein
VDAFSVRSDVISSIQILSLDMGFTVSGAGHGSCSEALPARAARLTASPVARTSESTPPELEAGPGSRGGLLSCPDPWKQAPSGDGAPRIVSVSSGRIGVLPSPGVAAASREMLMDPGEGRNVESLF